MEHYMEILKQFGVVMSVAGGIIGVILSFIVFFVFMSKKNKNRFHGFFGWLYNYLHFKNFIIEGLLKFFYVLGACVCTLVGIFNILCLQMVTGFAVLIFGNLLLRIVYEFALMIVVICRNVSEINKKMGGDVDYRTQFKECEIPPMPKKEDFVKKNVAEQAMRETAAARPEQDGSRQERAFIPLKPFTRQDPGPQEAKQEVSVPPQVIALGDGQAADTYSKPEIVKPEDTLEQNGHPLDVPLSDMPAGKCPECKKPLKKGDLFCGHCGRKLDQEK